MKKTDTGACCTKRFIRGAILSVPPGKPADRKKEIKRVLRPLVLFMMMMAAAVSPVAALAWGPDRDTFTMKNPPDHVVFNSIVDNDGEIGNELYFLSASEYTGSAEKNYWTDQLTVVEDGEYVLRCYVRNDCPDIDAEDVRAYMILPTEAGTRLSVAAKISAANAEPQTVWDETHLISKDGRPFTLKYVEGSAEFYTVQDGKLHSFSLDTNTYDLFTDRGFLLGYKNLNGIFPGGLSRSGYLTIHVVPQFSPLWKTLKAAFIIILLVVSAGALALWRKDRKTYDVFISYRRDNGYGIGKGIYNSLNEKKIKTFIDTHELGNGPFPKQIEEAIRSSRFFVLVLSPGALDRCANPEDWVRKEISLAWEAGLTIIPVIMPNFDIPAAEKNKDLPDYVRQVLKQQAVSMRDLEYYDEALERLRKRIKKKSLKRLLGGQGHGKAGLK